MSELEELSKKFIEKFIDTPVIKRRCMCCGKEFSTLEGHHICSECRSAQQRQEEEIHKRLKAAYDDGYQAGTKTAAQYIVDLLYADNSYTDNYFDLPKFESMIIQHFGLEAAICLG